MTVNSATAQTLTYDANGNMTSDGTNTYAWDAENRMIKITYPGTGNNSQFTFDAEGKAVQIQEFSAGSSTSNLAFVWCGNNRCETRSGTGFSTVATQFFNRGEMIAGTKYFYSLDHLGSVREITDSTGAVKSRYSYDPYGVATQTFVSGTITADFQYAGYYHHAPSGFSLTRTRAYMPSIGRFISRDDLENFEYNNLYAYALNNALNRIDPSGQSGIVVEGNGTFINGAVDGTAATGSVGLGIFMQNDFTGASLGSYAGGGAMGTLANGGYALPGGAGPGQGIALGSLAEAGVSLGLTNANSAIDLGGAFTTYVGGFALGPFGFSGSFSFSGPTWLGTVGVTPMPGAGFGAGVAKLNTTTPFTGSLGAPTQNHGFCLRKKR